MENLLDRVLCGDCVEVLKQLPDASVHTIVTDPPYGLEFMGEEWDTFKGGNTVNDKPLGAKRYQKWTTSWATEALRALKPGASMLVMGGTRTHHRMMCGVEDAGFEIKDTLVWAYNSGFPKAQDLGKMIDKRNERTSEDFKKLGVYLKTQRNLKELSEKELAKHFPSKTGGLTGCVWNWENGANVPTSEQWELLKNLLDLNDGFDWIIEREEAKRDIVSKNERTSPACGPIPNAYDGQRILLSITAPATDLAKKWNGWKVGGLKPAWEPIVWALKPPEGAFIDNVLKHGVGAINVDACRIPYESDVDAETAHNNALGPVDRYKTHKMIYGGGRKSAGFDDTFSASGRYPANMLRTDRLEDGYDRFYFVPKADRGERDEGLDGTPRRFLATMGDGIGAREHNPKEQNAWVKNIHPTIKPVALMQHLIKLVTREGQIVLDPFVGSGTTCVAARLLNRHYIGIDMSAEYCDIAKQRLANIPIPIERYAISG